MSCSIASVAYPRMAHATFHHHSPVRRSKSLQQKRSYTTTTRVDKTPTSSANSHRTRRSSADDRSAEMLSTLQKTQHRSATICERNPKLPVETSDYKTYGKRVSKPVVDFDNFKTSSRPSTRDHPSNGILHPEVNVKSILRNFSAASYRNMVLARHVQCDSESDSMDHSQATCTSLSSQDSLRQTTDSLRYPMESLRHTVDSSRHTVDPLRHTTDTPQSTEDASRHILQSSRRSVEFPRRFADSQSFVKYSTSRTAAQPVTTDGCKYRLRLNTTPTASKRVTFDDNITVVHHVRNRRRHSSPTLPFD